MSDIIVHLAMFSTTIDKILSSIGPHKMTMIHYFSVLDPICNLGLILNFSQLNLGTFLIFSRHPPPGPPPPWFFVWEASLLYKPILLQISCILYYNTFLRRYPNSIQNKLQLCFYVVVIFLVKLLFKFPRKENKMWFSKEENPKESTTFSTLFLRQNLEKCECLHTTFNQDC